MSPWTWLLAWPISLAALVARLLYLARLRRRGRVTLGQQNTPPLVWTVGGDGAYIEDWYFDMALD